MQRARDCFAGSGRIFVWTTGKTKGVKPRLVIWAAQGLYLFPGPPVQLAAVFFVIKN
jgi:hypothetical protein